MIRMSQRNTIQEQPTLIGQLGQGQVKAGPLSESSQQALQGFMNQVQNSGDFLKMEDGQKIEVTFDLEHTPGMRTRTINTKDGEKTIERFAFVVWNEQSKRLQYFELAQKWVRAALEAMQEYNTNTLVVKRTGSKMTDTSYAFMPPGLKRVSQ